MTGFIHWLAWIPLLPLCAAIITGVMALARKSERAAPFITIAATLISLFISAAVLARFLGGTTQNHLEVSFHWLQAGRFSINLGVDLTHLAALMAVLVGLVSSLVQIYSIGYMHGDGGYGRYFAYLALFTASMLGLVVANNLFQLYVCWELVGICSYLLIGFWFHKKSAADAAKKAFVVTRFGDVGFMLGVLILSSFTGSFSYNQVEQTLSKVAIGAIQPPFFSPATFLAVAALLLFAGAVGKSAQFPLHIWLPDAMEGPTPVSALIHAATMVAAGVYMVARLYPIFLLSSFALGVIAWIGAITAFIAATIAIVQTDIKKVLAYSTVSQLGYMMIGLGVGGYVAGVFHLATHAMFKALLFLAAGSVIHAMGTNDLREMGGLHRKMPITSLTCLAGILALAGFPGFAGFWSKDEVLGVALSNGQTLIFVIGVLSAGITAFYSLRLWLMAFSGRPRSASAEHAHEAPAVMTIPLIILAIGALFGGLMNFPHPFIGSLLNPAEHEQINLVAMGLSTAVGLTGLAWAWLLYAKPEMAQDPVERMPVSLYRTFANLWGVDAFFTNGVARWALNIGRMVAWFDRHVVDGAVNGAAWMCGASGRTLRRFTNGQAQFYAAVMIVAILLAVWLVLGAMQPPNLTAAAPTRWAVTTTLGGRAR